MSAVTVREKILARIKTVIAAVTTPTNLLAKVERNLSVAIARDEAPVVSVEPIADSPTNESVYRYVWRLKVRVALYVRGTIPDQVADPIIDSIHAAIMADITLGGISMDIEGPQVAFDITDSDAGAAIISMDYTVLYQTSRESMSTT